MCTLWLYASYSTGVAPLLISIFNSSSLPQLIHTCSEALQMSYFVFLYFLFLYFKSKVLKWVLKLKHVNVSFA